MGFEKAISHLVDERNFYFLCRGEERKDADHLLERFRLRRRLIVALAELRF